VEAYDIFSDEHDGFRPMRNIHEALASLIMMMEDAKIYNKDKYIMYADLKGAFTSDDHIVMFKHMRELGMPSSFVTACEQIYGVFITNYVTPYGITPHIEINRGTLQGDTLSPFPFTLFFEPFLRWLTFGSRGYIPCPPERTRSTTPPRKPTRVMASQTTSI
jgi:hypothetical protein